MLKTTLHIPLPYILHSPHLKGMDAEDYTTHTFLYTLRSPRVTGMNAEDHYAYIFVYSTFSPSYRYGC